MAWKGHVNALNPHPDQRCGNLGLAKAIPGVDVTKLFFSLTGSGEHERLREINKSLSGPSFPFKLGRFALMQEAMGAHS